MSPTAPLAMALALLAGCGARTTLTADPPGADASAPADAFVPRRDAGTDAGPPAIPCAHDADCASGVCRADPRLIAADLEPLPLVCGARDPGAADDAECDARTECGRGLCSLSGFCMRPCAADADCAEGERCRPQVFVQTSAAAMQPMSACSPLVTAASDVRVIGPEPASDLPTFEAATERLPPLDDASLVVWLARRQDTTPILLRAFALEPARNLLVDFEVERTETPRMGILHTTVASELTLLYPNGPGSPRAPARLEVELASLTSASATERVILTRAGGGGVIDLDVYLAGGRALVTPAPGELPRRLRPAITALERIYQSAGIRIGRVRVHDVVGGLRRRFESLDEMSTSPLMQPGELGELYRLSAGARAPSIPLFLVRSIEGALGIASGIPGPHGFAGLGSSGVAIALDLLDDDDQVAAVIAHELGHFLGLFHTSELDGSVNDPLPDTPECRLDRDTDGDGLLAPFECEGAGSDNLMYWAGELPNLSPQQAEIFRRAMIAHD